MPGQIARQILGSDAPVGIRRVVFAQLCQQPRLETGGTEISKTMTGSSLFLLFGPEAIASVPSVFATNRHIQTSSLLSCLFAESAKNIGP